MKLPFSTREWLIWLLIFYFVTAGAFSIVTPLFEAPDEHHHFFTARYIAQHQRLPRGEAGTLHRQEGAQPPLYYLLAATLTLPWPITPAEGEFELNPHAHTASRDAQNNFNVFLHPPDEDWQPRGVMVHLLRGFSVLLGAGSLLCIYATARLMWRNHPRYAVLAVAMVAALPQWLFLHSAVTNDTLLIFLVALTHCYLAHLWRVPLRPHHAWWLGVLIALAILTKNTGLLLLPYSALVLLAKARWRISWQLMQSGLVVAIPVLLLTGWHFWRNFTLYGDPTAVNVFIELGGGERELPAWFILQHLDLLWLSAIAFFGWMNVLAQPRVFTVWVSLLLAAGVGAVVGLLLTWRHAKQIGARHPERSEESLCKSQPDMRGLVALQALWPLLVFAAWFQFNLRTPAEQGRLLFPAIIPVALWVGYGVGQWRPRILSSVGVVAAMLTAVYCVTVVMPVAYPRLRERFQLAYGAEFLSLDVGLNLHLSGIQAHTPELHPGDTANFTLYWSNSDWDNVEPATASPLVNYELLGRDLRPVGKLDPAYHGGGMFPSNYWKVSGRVVEDIRIHVAEDASVPTLGRLYLRLEGQEQLVNLTTIKIIPRQWPAKIDTVLAELAGGITIAQASVTTTVTNPGTTLPVQVRWQVDQDVHAPLNTFVHLGQPGQPPVAQADGPALGGDYPAQYWGAGERFDDEYQLTIPDNLPFGEYAVMIGLYNVESGGRVPLSVNGERAPADALIVDWITIK